MHSHLSYYTKHLYQSCMHNPSCISISKKIRLWWPWIRLLRAAPFFRWAPSGLLYMVVCR
ncbi:uncharacterized protein LACBIDRAFT_302262 [Laccaria bicolor S238N-H82]|uniref:Predicted protein n=1 Tax=Laccaria bicolor (strain S238N-H82 / ATCC MYA-4686) TaxID=486041 RepID=B0DHF1_LACBS|nr:uncharacterized protein LACBIDRAFT_302262 [Laccaria bicolor S238N-H82]EDR06096.1 predicted protein [Laccaria bicolor S238N-H82]|eukprot:XP_001883384.1 predicted protein [Laccaria bicolor S238N-H82]